MTQRKHPYHDKPDRAFWNRAVTGRTPEDLHDLARGLPDLTALKIATAGSCFAQHIGRVLRRRGLNYMNCEPAPPLLKPQGTTFGYGLYTCRYGNIYTARQLWQLFQEAFGQRQPREAVWEREGRFFDALRPGIEPEGHGSAQEVLDLRERHLVRVRQMFSELELFVFTLGLTEYWADRADGTAYPTAPGVIAGHYDPDRHVFCNMRVSDVVADLEAFRSALKEVNPKAQILLTVSPVPLAATATPEHVLVATTYSKSVLRAAAGQIAEDHADVAYFPSYELITGQPSGHRFYEADLRGVRRAGVNVVMGHLLGAAPSAPARARKKRAPREEVGFEHCEESLLLNVTRQ